MCAAQTLSLSPLTWYQTFSTDRPRFRSFSLLMASPASSASGDLNPFAVLEPPTAAALRHVPIHDHIPITLDLHTPSFSTWRTYFSLTFREFGIRDHVDGSVDAMAMQHDVHWLAVDATIVKWLYRTVSREILSHIIRDNDTALGAWTSICQLFLDNRLQRQVLLTTEFYSLTQDGMGLFDYCLRLKVLADELRDVGAAVSDATMLTNLIRGLGPDYANAASNLNLLTEPTFARAVNYLRLEERRMRHASLQRTQTALAVGTTRAPAAPNPVPAPAAPPAAASPPGNTRKKKRGNDGRPRSSGQPSAGPRPPAPPAAPAPWFGGVNPWTGVVHAWAMPPTRAPHPGILGPRPGGHQALLAAPQPGGVPPPPPSSWPPAPTSSWTGASSSTYDPALLAALQQAPPPSAYPGNGDWFMDTGASSHMASHPDQDGAAPM
nr:translation initiation factor IF-2-like isoform X2 [Aegilops tauschii subsp. strangulata]